MSIVTELARVVGRSLRGLTVIAIGHGIVQGLAALVLVPVARGLAEPGPYGPYVVLVVVTVLAAVLAHRQAVTGFGTAVAVMRTLQLRIGTQLARLPLSWLGPRRAEITELTVRGSLQVGGAPGYLMTPLVSSVTTVAVTTLGLIVLEWRLGIPALVGILAVWATSRWASHLMVRDEPERHGAQVELERRVIEYARAQRVLRAAGTRRYEPLERALDQHQALGRQGLWSSVGGMAVTGVSVQLVFSVLVIALGWLVVLGRVGPVELVALFAVVSRLVEPLNQISGYRAGIAATGAQVARMAELLDADPLTEPASPVPSTGDGQVELDEVSFGHTEGRTVLHEVSFRVAPTSVTAVVGPSGAGKSTLAMLIARQADVDAGAVRVGGVDVRDQTWDGLADQLAVVHQDPYLFDCSVRENIALADPTADPARMAAIAQLAGVDEIVARLPQGWDTEVGEGGSRLSGGERQRVAVARALLKPSSVLVLDEATSALDVRNQRIIAEAVEQVRRERAVIVIAHRLEAVRDADQIVVLDPTGRIAERGTHDELVTGQGWYAQAWRARERARGWRLRPRSAG